MSTEKQSDEIRKLLPLYTKKEAVTGLIAFLLVITLVYLVMESGAGRDVNITKDEGVYFIIDGWKAPSKGDTVSYEIHRPPDE